MLWLIFSFFSLLFAYLGKSSSNLNLELYYSNLEERGYTHASPIKTRSVLYRCALAFTLSIFIAIVSPSGTDHSNYVDMYAEYQKLDTEFSIIDMLTSYNIEIGYQLLNVAGNYFHLSVPVFFFFLALITNSLFVSVIYRFKNPVFVTLVFILSMTFAQEVNLVRQCLAVAIFIYSIKYLEYKDPYRFVLFILIAFAFHSSAMFLLPLLVLCYFNWQKYDRFIRISLNTLWVISLLVAFNIVSVDLIGKVVSLLGSSRYVGYAENMGDMGFASVVNYFNILVVVILIQFNNKNLNIYYYLFLIGCILQNLSTNNLFLMRFSMYFMAIFPFFMGEVVNHLNYKNKYKSIVKMLYVVFIIYFSYTLFFGYVLGSPALGKECYSLSNFF